ncbi:MAG: hypothetical protein KGI54_08925 [Pseudomonadota bacterium]|nr:hypothetical protein [Pseudomonadota bacterium]
MSDLETQDDLRSSLENAFEEVSKNEPVEEPVKELEKEPEKLEEKTEVIDTPEIKEEPVVPVKRPPSSWKKETQAEWEKLPAHVQDDVLRRESDFHKGIETYKQAAQRAQAFEQAIAPYQNTLKTLGVAPEVAIGELFKADNLLRNSAPHEKAAYFAQLAKDYGVQLEDIQQPPQVDPAYQQLLNEVRSMKQTELQREQQRQQAEQATLNSTIAKFSEGKEHFEAVREDMAALLQAGRAADLETAYDMAIWARPDLRSGLLEQQTRAAEEKARAVIQQRKAQSAAVSVRGSSPVSGSASQPANIRAALEAAFNT